MKTETYPSCADCYHPRNWHGRTKPKCSAMWCDCKGFKETGCNCCTAKTAQGWMRCECSCHD